MARDLSNLFSLLIPDNDQNSVSAIAKTIAFDDVGDFASERERIRRKVELAVETEPKVDYSDFSQHVFFDSALSKFEIAKNKMLSSYPFAGNQEDKDLFTISSSYYENYVTDSWPRFAGYLNFTGSNQYVGVQDTQSLLCLNSSSLYISARLQPSNFAQRQSIVEVMSGSKTGYSFAVMSGAMLNLTIYSGSTSVSLSAALPSISLLTQSFHTYAAIYDQPTQLLSLYSDTTRLASGSVGLGSVNFSTAQVLVGNSLFASGTAYNGLVGDVRVMHTASELYHKRNSLRSVPSEDFVKLYYKFNEGITGLSSSDAVAIDYSKTGLHGLIYNYGPQTRFSGASLVQDDGDPILYGFHPTVMAFSASVEASASAYDAQNRNHILRLIPETLLEDDQNSQGLLISFSLAMARYFDELKVSVDQFDNLRVTNYDDSNETPDIMLPMLKKYFGWKVTDHFGDANPLEFFFGDNVLATGSLNQSLHEVRNQFWRRILNSLPYLYKTKGKRNNLDSFFNVLGINNDLLNLKEYGYLNSNSITDDRISKNKPLAFLGFGSGSSVQRVVMPNFLSGANNPEWTIETVAQLPYAGMPFTSSGLIGTVWQMYDATGLGYSLQWKVNVPGANAGYLRFKDDSYGAYILTPPLPIFNGQFVHIATTLSNATASLQVRQVNNGLITSSVSYNSASGPLTSGSYSFLVGAGSGAYAVSNAAGFYGEVRYWNRQLSSSELDAHALDFQNVGIRDAKYQKMALRGHWTLDEYKPADNTGAIIAYDHSQRGNNGKGSSFVPYANPYQKTLTNYQFLSPSVDLKWTNNKVRVRNKTQLALADIASDTNQVTLEFNLVDALNEDISKIFSTLDMLNQSIGSPVNKYREDYQDLEALRRVYFSRLGDSVNFTQFFKLFRWFDRKLASSIKQLLPARVDFIGGEFTVDSHMLERNKYQYKFPVFHTPKDISDGVVKGIVKASGSLQKVLAHEGSLCGTYVQTQHDDQRRLTPKFRPREASVLVDGVLGTRLMSRQIEGHEREWRNRNSFHPIKVSGDTPDSRNSSQDGSNYRNPFTRATLTASRTVTREIDGASNDVHYIGLTRKTIRLCVRGLSGSAPFSSLTGSVFSLASGSSIELSQSLWDINNNLLDTGSFTGQVFNCDSNAITQKYEPVLVFSVSASLTTLNSNDFQVQFKDGNSVFWNSYRSISPYCTIMSSGLNDGWNKFECRMIINGVLQLPTIGFNGSNTHFLISVNNGSYFFKDIQLRFNQQLSDYGVSFYKVLDNQNNKTLFQNNNRSLMPVVDMSASRYTEFNAWTVVPSYGAMSASSIIRGIKCDSSGTYYAIGGTNGPTPDPFLFSTTAASLLSPSSLGWQVFKSYDGLNYNIVDQVGPSASPLDMVIDANDNVYVCGYGPYTGTGSVPLSIRSSLDRGNTWTTVLSTGSIYTDVTTFPPTTGGLYVTAVGIDYDSNGAIYCLGNMWRKDNTYRQNVTSPYLSLTSSWVMFKSPSGKSGTFSMIFDYVYPDSLNNFASKSFASDLIISRSITGNDSIYACGITVNSNAWNTTFGGGAPGSCTGILLKSNDYGATWPTYFTASNKAFTSMMIDGYGNMCIAGQTPVGSITKWLLMYSGSSTSNTFMSTSVGTSPSAFIYFFLPNPMVKGGNASKTLGNITVRHVMGDGYYASGVVLNPYFYDHVIAKTGSLSSSDSSWKQVTKFSDAQDASGQYQTDTTIESIKGKLYAVGNAQKGGFIRVGYPVFRNNDNIGLRSLATSYAYVRDELTFPALIYDPTNNGFGSTAKFALNNVNEYPHYGGLFQMRNIVLGTQTKGRIGKTDDSLIQVRHVGSVVEVMWPNQATLDSPVQGFGELSVGQSPGKLQTSFNFGSLIDVSQYDHMSLYCYLQKQASGTLDDIVVRIERRPLSSVGFAVDQSVEFDNSGSFTEARYKDILHTKLVDYGDLGLKEISYVIDQPLTNVREIRVGARLKNGQIDANQNFLIWGRFIKSANET